MTTTTTGTPEDTSGRPAEPASTHTTGGDHPRKVYKVIRNDQLLLPIPVHPGALVVPKWDTGNDVPGWVLTAAEIDMHHESLLWGQVLYTREGDGRQVRVGVRWNPQQFGLEAQCLQGIGLIDGTTPRWPDGAPGGPAPALRPDQMLLPVPALDQAFVIPRWTTDDVPPGWVFLAAEIDAHRLTCLSGRFIFRHDVDRRFVAVWVQWSSESSRLTTTSGEPDTGEPLDQAFDGDTARIEEMVLHRAERFIDLLTMVGSTTTTPATHHLLLEAIGIRPSERLT